MYTIKSISIAVIFLLFNIFGISSLGNAEIAESQDVIQDVIDDKKDQMCSFLGCEGGDRDCAEVSITMEVSVKGVVGGSAEVTYFCYEEE